MTKYHLGSDGNPKICKALKGACPLGGSHFDSSESASTFYEESMCKLLELPEDIDCDLFTTEDYTGRSKAFFNSISKKDKEFIQNYVQQEYSEINKGLWSGKKTTKYSRIEKILSKESGDKKSLWRTPPRKSIDILVSGKKIGDIIELKGFTSTSEAPRAIMPLMQTTIDTYLSDTEFEELKFDANGQVEIPEEYSKKDPNIVFQFVTSQGAPTSDLSHMKQEKEFLLPSNTQWKIVGIKKNIIFSSSKDMFGDPSSKISRKATVYQLMEA